MMVQKQTIICGGHGKSYGCKRSFSGDVLRNVWDHPHWSLLVTLEICCHYLYAFYIKTDVSI